jgi:hypothetical protein
VCGGGETERDADNIIMSRHENERAALVGGRLNLMAPALLGEFGSWRAILMGLAAGL